MKVDARGRSLHLDDALVVDGRRDGSQFTSVEEFTLLYCPSRSNRASRTENKPKLSDMYEHEKSNKGNEKKSFDKRIVVNLH